MADYTPISAPPWPRVPTSGVPANFNQSTAATFELAPAVAGKKNRLYFADWYVFAAQTITFKSGSDAIVGGTFQYGSAGGALLGYMHGHHIETREGEALNVTLGSAVQVRGPYSYRAVLP